jgi:hypothetical protein
MQQNYSDREKILAPYSSSSAAGGLRYFRTLPLKELERLVERHLVDLDGWNDCPGVLRGFLPFLKRNPLFTAHGYADLGDGEEARVTIEGVEKNGYLDRGELIDFVRTFKDADEFELTDSYARCWYD